MDGAKKSFYGLTFVQPRQEELVTAISYKLKGDEQRLSELRNKLMINLSLYVAADRRRGLNNGGTWLGDRMMQELIL